MARTSDCLTALENRWISEARRHEGAAQDHFERDRASCDWDEERLLHLEIARVLRNCARELSELTVSA